MPQLRKQAKLSICFSTGEGCSYVSELSMHTTGPIAKNWSIAKISPSGQILVAKNGPLLPFLVLHMNNYVNSKQSKVAIDIVSHVGTSPQLND